MKISVQIESGLCNVLKSFVTVFSLGNTNILPRVNHRFGADYREILNDFSICHGPHEFGSITLHDTDPISEKYLDKRYCGDSYRVLDWLKVNHPEMSVITLPVSEAGLTIIKRSSDRRVNKFLK
jgi:hypothetical protein